MSADDRAANARRINIMFAAAVGATAAIATAPAAYANSHSNTCFISNDWHDQETRQSMAVVKATIGVTGDEKVNDPDTKWGSCKNSKAVAKAMNQWINANNCRSVHVITHGGGGKLQLPCTQSGNNTTLSTASIIQYQADTNQLGDAGVDFYVYSCGCKKPETNPPANNRFCADQVVHPATTSAGEPGFIAYTSTGNSDQFATKATLFDWSMGYGGFIDYILGDEKKRTAKKDLTFWTWANSAWTATGAAQFAFEPFSFND